MFEDVGHERFSILLLSPTDPDKLKKSKFTDHEKNLIRNLALEKLNRQKRLKENLALQLLEFYFLFDKLLNFQN